MKNVYINLNGGLGNQFFCYALAYSVAKKTGKKLVIDTSLRDTGKIIGRNLELLNFDVKYDKRISYRYIFNPKYRKLGIDKLIRRFNIGLTTEIFEDPNYLEYHPEVFKFKNNIYFDGYFQSHHYFDEYRDDIIKMFVPSRKLSDSAKRFLNEIENTNSVSLHVRRGDYVDVEWCLPMHYYNDALTKMREKLQGKISVYIFTDDKVFARNYFSDIVIEDLEFIIYEYESDNYVADDIYLMSKCKNNIIANSTYSWWGAYFNTNNSKIVMCPNYSVWKDDYYLEDWIKIDVM